MIRDTANPEAQASFAPLPTYFAPAERASAAELEAASAAMAQDPMATQLLDPLPCPAMLLNGARQILFGNAALRGAAGKDHRALLGLRPGEALNCEQLPFTPNGCGTGIACRQCGAAKAIVRSLASHECETEECQFSGTEPRPLCADFRVTAYPVSISGQVFTALILEDIGAAKRSAALERALFCEVRNTSASLHALVGSLSSAASGEHDIRTLEAELHKVSRLSGNLVAAVEQQRKSMDAEAGSLVLELAEINIQSLLQELHRRYSNCPEAQNRLLRLVHAPDVLATSDQALVESILGNLTVNALEATPERGVVSLWCYAVPGGFEFTVHNSGVIPEPFRGRLFHSSFSTKAEAGRGAGLYTARLFAERCLGGRIRFTTDEADGTRFQFLLPHGPVRTPVIR